MGYGIVAVVAAIVAQAGGPAPKTSDKKPDRGVAAAVADQRRPGGCCRTAVTPRRTKRYAAVEAEAKKEPGGLTPALKVAVVLGKAECQASQGDYVKAIGELKHAGRPGAQERRRAGAVGQPLSDSRRLAGRRGGDAPGTGSSMRTTCWRAGFKLGCSNCTARSIRPSPPASGLSIVSTTRDRKSSRTPMPCF